MTDKNTPREAKKIQELARDYSSKGFHVSVGPRGKEIPEFLRMLHFSPDLIAESEAESHVIEVTSRETAERLRELTEVVEAIEKRRGWNFILVMTNPRTPSPAPSVTAIPILEELDDAFETVSKLAKLSAESGHGFSHAVLLSAWAIVEGALRMYLDSGKVKKRVHSPISIVRDAVMMGFITRSEGEFLDSVARTRNDIAHGAVSLNIPISTIDRLLKLCGSLATDSKKKGKTPNE